MNRLQLLVLVGLAYAQLFTTFAADESDSIRAPQKTEFQSTTIIVPASTKAQLLVIEAKINDRGPYRFIFDTGTSGIVLNADFASELGLTSTGKSHIGDPSNPNAFEADTHRIDKLSIEGAVFTGVEAISLEPPPQIAQALKGTRGIIGLSLFGDCLMTLDLRKKQMILERGELPEINGVDILRLDVHGEKSPTVRLRVGGIDIDAHIDSGKPGGVALPTNMQDRFKLKGKPVVVGRGRTANSTFDVLAATLDGNVEVGGHVIKEPNLSFVSLLDDPGVANIGTGILRDLRMTLDQKNGRIRFEDQRR